MWDGPLYWIAIAVIGFVAGYARARWEIKKKKRELVAATAEKIEPMVIPANVVACTCDADWCACERATTPRRGVCSRCRFGHHTYRRQRPEAPELKRRHFHTELCYLTEYGATTHRIQCGYREGEAER